MRDFFSKNNSSTSEYRPDIDGLRSIAVLSVIIFHLKSTWLSGGYLGVDVFFVISGFLITQIIINELTSNSFTFSKFYLRRIRRILPVFVVVIIVTLFIGALLLIPDDFNDLSKSIFFSLAFLSNVFFSKEGGYFELSTDQKPLHHIWSLSVEEQFYLLWPLLIFILFKLSRSKSTQRIVFVIILLALFAISEYFVRTNIQKSYYLLTTRAAELFVGTTLAILPKTKWDNRYILFLVPILLTVVLFNCFFFYDSSTSFPGLMSAIPTISAAGLIYFGVNSNNFVYKILSSKPFVWVGKLSYSLYLWHWPILAYFHYVYNDKFLPISWIVLAFILTFFFSILSYYFVEKPFRQKNWSFRRALILIYVIPSLAIVLVVFGIKYSPLMTKFQRSVEYTSYGEHCHGAIVGDCIRGDKIKKPTVLMIGDSHTAHYNGFIDIVGSHEGWSAVVVSASSCSPIFDFNEKVLPQWAQQQCVDIKKYVEENWEKFDIIFIASLWSYQLGYDKNSNDYDPDFYNKLDYTISRFVKSGKKVYLLSDIPRLPNSPSRIEKFRIYGLDKFVKPQTNEYLIANEKIMGIVKKYSNVFWINTYSFIPESTLINGKSIYMDEHHLNTFGSQWLGEEFTKNSKILF